MNKKILKEIVLLGELNIKYCLMCFLVLGSVLCAVPVLAQYSEYEKKAGMVYTFGKMVTWPDKAFDDEGTLVLGILGDDPFGEVIDRVLKNRPVNGHHWEVRRGQEIKDLKGSHIIFFTDSYPSYMVREMLEEVYSRNNSMVLTIGDGIDDFCQMGGIVNLQPTLAYNLNVSSANKAELTLDVKLLNLASDIVSYGTH